MSAIVGLVLRFLQMDRQVKEIAVRVDRLRQDMEERYIPRPELLARMDTVHEMLLQLQQRFERRRAPRKDPS